MLLKKPLYLLQISLKHPHYVPCTTCFNSSYLLSSTSPLLKQIITLADQLLLLCESVLMQEEY